MIQKDSHSGCMYMHPYTCTYILASTHAVHTHTHVHYALILSNILYIYICILYYIYSICIIYY